MDLSLGVGRAFVLYFMSSRRKIELLAVEVAEIVDIESAVQAWAGVPLIRRYQCDGLGAKFVNRRWMLGAKRDHHPVARRRRPFIVWSSYGEHGLARARGLRDET